MSGCFIAKVVYRRDIVWVLRLSANDIHAIDVIPIRVLSARKLTGRHTDQFVERTKMWEHTSNTMIMPTSLEQDLEKQWTCCQVMSPLFRVTGKYWYRHQQRNRYITTWPTLAGELKPSWPFDERTKGIHVSTVVGILENGRKRTRVITVPSLRTSLRGTSS